MELGGKGIGSQLVEKVLLDIEKKDLRLVPLCPFVAGYIQKHPDWKRIVMSGATCLIFITKLYGQEDRIYEW